MFPILIGLLTYIGTAALGTAAQLGLVNTHPFRWLHHVLYALVLLTLGGAVVFNWGKPLLAALVPVCVCMGVMPTLRAGTRRHCWNAILGGAFYAGALVWSVVLLFSGSGA